jgi:hypothetical protein
MVIESSTFEELEGFDGLSGFESLYVVGDDHVIEAREIVDEAMHARQARRIALIAGAASTVACAGILIAILLLIDTDFVAYVTTLKEQGTALTVPLVGVLVLAALSAIMIAQAFRRVEEVQRACHTRIAEIGYPLRLIGYHVTATMSEPLALEVARIQSDADVILERIGSLEEKRMDLQRFRSISSDGQRELRRLNAQIKGLQRSREQLNASVTVLLDPRPGALTA